VNPIFPLRFELSTDERRADVLLLFVASDELDESAFADAVEAQVNADLRPDILLLIVRDTSFEASRRLLTTSSAAVASRQRLEPSTTVELSGYSETGDENRRELLGGPQPAVRVEYSDLRRRGVTDIFLRRGGFVGSTPAFHFENPSGRHTERFMRLSNILVRSAEISFIAFATLPWIPRDAKVAYVDTPAVLAVISSISEQLGSFGRRPLQADSFGSYLGRRSYRFTRRDEAVVVISASSSGGLSQELVHENKFDVGRIVHLLYLGRSAPPDRLVCNLATDPIQNPRGVDRNPMVEPKDDCRLCASGSLFIKLHGDQFDISGPQPEPLTINRDDAPARLREQMGRLAGIGVLGIVPGADSRQAHRLFDISEDGLLASPAFCRRLDFAFRRGLPGAISHIIHAGERSAAFAEHVRTAAEAWGAKPDLVAASELDRMAGAQVTSVAVVAAAIESGRTFLDISRDLRSIIGDAPVTYLVGVEKTTALEHRRRLERTLSVAAGPLANLFVPVESVVLPASDRRQAWLAELNFLRSQQTVSRMPEALRAFFDTRLKMLRRGSEPVRDGIFLPNHPDARLTVQPGFVFWPERLTKEGAYTQADVFFTVASILQHLRARAREPGMSAIRSNPFQQTLLAPENFGRFNDDAIQASLLRAATAGELNYEAHPEASAQASRLIRRVLASADRPRGGAAAEFLLACRRLSLLPSDRESILDVSIDPDAAPVAAFLAEVCRHP
jgi:hypothetical protein